MAKRGNGEGSIYPRRNKEGKTIGYTAAYWVDTAGGQKRKVVYAKTRTDAAAKLARAIADRDGGVVYDAPNLTVGDYLDSWLVDSVRGTVRQRTYERYESIVRVHIKPAFGRAKLKSLSPNKARALYREKLDGGLSPRSVRYIHATLRKALGQAVSDGLIPRNACTGIKPPQPGKPEIQPMSREQARRLVGACADSEDRHAAMFVLALHTGLRSGEALGLKWEDVDLDGGTVHIRRTLSETRDGYVFEKPKNGKGRAVGLSRGAATALRRHRESQSRYKHACGARYHDEGLVFPNGVGKPQSGTSLISRSFRPLLEEAGLPREFRIHDLRHTCATILLQQGKHPKYVQELLGHASISITLDTYSHVIEGMDGGLPDAMDEALDDN